MRQGRAGRVPVLVPFRPRSSFSHSGRTPTRIFPAVLINQRTVGTPKRFGCTHWSCLGRRMRLAFSAHAVQCSGGGGRASVWAPRRIEGRPRRHVAPFVRSAAPEAHPSTAQQPCPCRRRHLYLRLAPHAHACRRAYVLREESKNFLRRCTL